MKLNRRIANLIITGFSGTGKSLVGKEVARRLNWDFIDTDDEIVQQTSKPIAEIFRDDGEGMFRKLEREAIRKACRQRQLVIAIGGGAIVDQQNYRLLSETGLIVCLEAKPETIYERLFREAACSPETEVRPLLTVANPLERIRQLKADRQSYYAKADWTIHTDGLSISEVAREVIRAWRLLRHAENCELSNTGDKDITCFVETATQSYPVFVGYGLLNKLGEKMKKAALSGTATIISDENVFSLYGTKVKRIIKSAGFSVNSFVVPPGEETKSMNYAVKSYDFLVEHRAERDDIIIALGGGRVGDLAGFVAATV
jgi:shikimate kinase/3-dehydroquinate synthase